MLEKLDNNEAILLMYLADELPPEDRAEIERMLAGDESLGRQLVAVRLAAQTTEHTLRALDAASPTGGRNRMEPGSPGEAAAIRRINRSIRSHLARKIAERPAPAARRGLRYPWWCYPTAAVAASVLAFAVWFANNVNNSPINIPGPDKFLPMQSPLAADSPKVKALNQFWGPSDDSAQAQQEQIAEGVRQLAALSNGGDDDAAVWNISTGTLGSTNSGAVESHD